MWLSKPMNCEGAVPADLRGYLTVVPDPRKRGVRHSFDGDDLDAAISAWSTSSSAADSAPAIAVDGKSLRRTYTPTTPRGAAPVQSIGPRRGGTAVRRSVDNSAGTGLAVDNRR
ncbi:hypothetical protein GCM10017567_31270 [Amycolatopsis bullii]|uniref:Transposase n=1 Tax=Amycolatopsis bullii TaxID=941987 RepID=A0ABQ3KC10_9PSEU|nr:hypothetical protein GCM10017567_31270 [Amycolatopsis bullii]